MKNSLVLLLVIAAISVSGFVVSQTTLVEPTYLGPTVPYELTSLENQVANADRSFTDRNSRLRLERAEMYLVTAKKYQAARWERRALDHAERGLRLIKLRESNLAQSI